MYNILKAELKYFLIPLSAIALFSISFTLFAFAETTPFQGTFFLSKYFWSMVVGMGTYMFVFIIWTLRKKELRDHFHFKLPVQKNKIALVRWTFGVAPFLLTYIYLEMLGHFISKEQTVFISRINAQLSILFVFIISFDIVLNIGYLIEKYRVLIYAVAVLSIIGLSSALIYLVTIAAIPPFFFGREEFYFFTCGFLLSIIDAVIYKNRKSFLG